MKLPSGIMASIKSEMSLLGGYLRDTSPWTLVGYAATGYLTLTFTQRCLWTPFKLYVLAQLFPVDLKKYGEWAVVTGATDGIGQAYAIQLAKTGFNIVLISRSLVKLKRVQSEIMADNNVKVKVVVADYSEADMYERISKEIDGLDIGVLVNNVGMCPQPGLLHLMDEPIKTHQNLLNVNCLSMTEMCVLVMPLMAKKNKGVIVNISSVLHQGGPIQFGYSASKAYVSRLSLNLSQAYSQTGIIVQVLESGFVRTPLSNVLNANLPRLSPLGIYLILFQVPVESYVKSAINTIGWSNRCNGHLKHLILDSGIFMHGLLTILST